MDERERLKRRQAALLNARRQGRRTRQEENSQKDFFLFRTYVTMMIVGLAIALSLIQTDSAQNAVKTLKQAIAYQVPLSDIRQAGMKAVGVFQNGGFSVDELKKKQNQQNPTTEEKASKKQKEKTAEFEPDIPSDEEIP